MKDIYEIKEAFDKNLTFLSKNMRNFILKVKDEQGLDGLIKLREGIEADKDDDLNVYTTNPEMKKLISDVSKADNPVITEGDNLFASKADIQVFDDKNKPSTIYRGEYFYLLNKDNYNSYISSATNKRTKDKHDFIVDNSTFSNNFVSINKESVESEMEALRKKNEELGMIRTNPIYSSPGLVGSETATGGEGGE